MKEHVLQWIGHAYIYGGTGQPCTPAYRRARQAQYPSMATAIRVNCPVLSGRQATCTGCRWEGKKAFDCAQLTRRTAESVGLSLPSGATSQWRKGEWKQKGTIDTLPKDKIAFLYKEKNGKMVHTGVYLGDGSFVHARDHRAGVIRQDLSAYLWTHWAILGDGVSGTVEDTPTFRVIKITEGQRLLRGELIEKMQIKLEKQGYAVGGIDGVYGRKTEAAVKAYQIANGIEANGIVTERLYNTIIDAKTSENSLYTVVIRGLNQAKKEELTNLYPQAIIQIERM